MFKFLPLILSVLALVSTFITVVDVAPVFLRKRTWGENYRGTMDREAVIMLEESGFFYRTTKNSDGIVIIDRANPPFAKVFPRAVRKQDGLSLERKPYKGMNKITDNVTPGKTQDHEHGSPYELQPNGKPFFYAGFNDNDKPPIDMGNFIEKEGQIVGGRLNWIGFHKKVMELAGQHLGDADLTPAQYEGFGKYMSKLIQARDSRQQGVDSGEEASNAHQERLAALKDVVNQVLLKEGSLYYQHMLARKAYNAAKKACSGSGSSSPRSLTPHAGCKGGRAFKLSKLRLLEKMKPILGDRMFPGERTPANPPADGKWEPSDILDGMPDTDDAMDIIWESLAFEIGDAVGDPQFDKQAEFAALTDAWGKELDSASITMDNIEEDMGFVYGYNILADRANLPEKSLKKLKMEGCSSKTTTCSRAKARNIDQKKLDLLQQAKELDTSGKIFSEGVSLNNPPDDGWIASDIVDGAGDTEGDMDGVMDSVVDVLIETAETQGFNTWEDMQKFMNKFEDTLTSDTVTEDNVNSHLNSVRAYNKMQRYLAKKGQTNPSSSNRAVGRIPFEAIGAFDQTIDDGTDLSDLMDFITEARLVTNDARIASGDMSNPEPGDLFQGAATMEDVVDGVGNVLAEQATTPDENGNTRGLDRELQNKWKRLINRQALRLISKPKNERDLKDVANYESHLNSFNAAVKPAEQIRNAADLRPLDHVASVLTMDSLVQAKELTGSQKLLPNGDPSFEDGADEAIPSSLFEGATTEDEAVEGLVDEIRDFVGEGGAEGKELTRNQKLQLKRVTLNLAKKAEVKENDLEGGIRGGEEIGQGDISSYVKVTDAFNRLSDLGINFDSIEGISVSDGTASNVDGVSDGFPSYSGSKEDMIWRSARDYNSYRKLVGGTRRNGAKAKKFLGKNRNTLRGRVRSSVGTNRGSGSARS